jgi:hypothetical protein
MGRLVLEADYQLQLILYINFRRHDGDRRTPRQIPPDNALIMKNAILNKIFVHLGDAFASAMHDLIQKQ